MTSRIVTALALIVAFAVCIASAPPSLNPVGRPGLPLPEAYGLSLNVMGSLTNEFYCVQARSGDRAWTFVYYSEKAQMKMVRVGYDKSASFYARESGH
jgi:hypothetical protein